MIDTIVKRRRMTLGNITYQRGDTVPMPLQQFNDLEPTGFVDRKPAPKAKVTPSKSDDAAD